MTVPIDPADAARRQRSLNARINNAAKESGVPAPLIRKRYTFALFLKHFFSGPDPLDHWVLLGGTALVLRTGGGRFTQDIDLANRASWQGPFGYGTKTAKAFIRVWLGNQQFDQFTIDVTDRHLRHAEPEPLRVSSPFPHYTLQNLPVVLLVPVEHHLADKVCTMYEKHGAKGQPSTRYRDLADIVRIVQRLSLRAGPLREVLDHETARRKLVLPRRLVSPGETWAQAFPRAARGFVAYPTGLLNLNSALGVCGDCLNPVLNNSRTTGTWSPDMQAWIP